MKHVHVAYGLVLALLVVNAASASGWIVPKVPADGERLGLIQFRLQEVNTTIHDQIATTRVEQVFFNPTSRRLEATYYFPIPRDANIDRFSMFIDGTEVEGELLDAAKAREIYESIVRQMKDPALLEFMDHGLFRVRVFPFEPNSERRIRLQYTSLLPKDSDVVAYTLPLRSSSAAHAGPRRPATPTAKSVIHININASQPIKAVYSPTHEVEISRPNERSAIIAFESGSTSSEGAFQLLYGTDSGSDDIGLTLLTHRPNETEDGYFMLLASPRVSLDEDEKVIDKDVVFVLDTSGSMSGGKLDQAKRALNFCVDNLNDNDRFEIVRFSTEVETAFGSLVDRNEANIEKARRFIKDLRPTGMTAIDDALATAIRTSVERENRDRPCVVIFLTDGRPTIGERDEVRIVDGALKAMKEAEANVRVFSFGIGSDVNTYLLDRLSQQTRAVSEYVLANEDIESKVSRFYTKINDPVLANLELSIEGAGRISKIHPTAAELPDLFKGEQLVVVGRYSSGGDAIVRLTGQANGSQRMFATEARFVEKSSDLSFVPRLWAMRRIGFLLDEIRQHGENEEAQQEVARLARAYGIVTPYTAYLIIEDEARRDVPALARSVQAPAAPAREAYKSQSLRTGDSSVAASQSNMQMRAGNNLAAMEQSQSYAARGTRGVDQQARLIRGRAFVQNGEVWIDSNIQDVPDAKRVQVAFDSDAYYDLLRNNPDAAAWLALGRNVQFLIADTVYEVTDG